VVLVTSPINVNIQPVINAENAFRPRLPA